MLPNLRYKTHSKALKNQPTTKIEKKLIDQFITNVIELKQMAEASLQTCEL